MKHLLVLAALTATIAAGNQAFGAGPAAVKLKTKVDPMGGGRYRAQLVAGPAHPVGEAITIAGQTIPARTSDKGDLELDLHGNGKWRSFARASTFPVVLEQPAAKEGGPPRKRPIKIGVTRDDAGVWTWQNLTVVRVQFGADVLTLVDGNGDGTWNDPHEDLVAWPDEAYAFPLPKEDEPWCTPNLAVTAFTVDAWAEEVTAEAVPITTTCAAATPVLRATNGERVKIGLTPRPEDAALSADLQKHCHWMATNGKLAHAEEPGTPGFSQEGNASGLRSILSAGAPADRVAHGMVTTLYHRQDVIRPETIGFGVGYEGAYGGIDGRTGVGRGLPANWPILCPAPGGIDVPPRFSAEAPDPIGGDGSAGFPITAYFATDQVELADHRLVPIAKNAVGPPVECYVFDGKQGAEVGINRYQRMAALIPKEPLLAGTTYRVTMSGTVAGQAWDRTWEFTTAGGPRPPGR